MTSNEELAAKGRIVTEYAAAKSKVAAMRGEAQRFGKLLTALGNKLTSTPEYVSIKGQGLNAKYMSQRVDFRDDWPNPQNVADLTDELRQALDDLERLTEQMKNIGAL